MIAKIARNPASATFLILVAGLALLFSPLNPARPELTWPELGWQANADARTVDQADEVTLVFTDSSGGFQAHQSVSAGGGADLTLYVSCTPSPGGTSTYNVAVEWPEGHYRDREFKTPFPCSISFLIVGIDMICSEFQEIFKEFHLKNGKFMVESFLRATAEMSAHILP